jgi:hypothetical protein
MHVKPDKPKQFVRWLTPASVVVVVIASAVGLLIDVKGFLGNILSEIAGIFASIIIALLIVDRYIEYQKEQQWARVRNLTYAAIVGHLCDLATETLIYFPVKDHRLMTPIIEGRDRPNPATITAMAKLASLLRQLSSAISNEKSTSDLAVEFYRAVKWDLDQIQNVLTPRVMQSSTDQQIINALVEFDNARRKLHNAIIVHRKIVTHSAFPAVIELLEQTQALYSAICEKWK